MKIFTKDNHKIIWGDCIPVMKNKVTDNSIDLIFADPPYNIGKDFNGRKDNLADKEYLTWSYKWLDLCIKKLKKTGSLYVMTSTQYMPYFDIYLRDKLTVLSRIAWHYDSSAVQAKRYFGSLYEPILFCVKDKNNYTFNSKAIRVKTKTGAQRKLIDYRKNPPKPYNTHKTPGNVWEFTRVRYRMEEYEKHPTQKPEALLEMIVKASSNENDLVLDPFSGTFTTSYVAKKLNRQSIGIEIDEDYIKIGLRRAGIRKQYKNEVLIPNNKTYKIKNKKQLV